jgi:hypothetical protein
MSAYLTCIACGRETTSLAPAFAGLTLCIDCERQRKAEKAVSPTNTPCPHGRYGHEDCPACDEDDLDGQDCTVCGKPLPMWDEPAIWHYYNDGEPKHDECASEGDVWVEDD